MARIVGRVLEPMLTKIGGTVNDFALSLSRWLAQNQNLITGLFKVGAAATVAGLALAGIGTALIGGAASISLVIGSLALVKSAIAAAFAVAPVAAAAGALAYLASQTNIAAKAVEFLSERFTVLKNSAALALNGIAEALKAGDLQLAASVLWKGLHAQWIKGIGELNTEWLSFKRATLEVANDIGTGFSNVWIHAVAAMKEVFVDFMQFLTSGFSTAAGLAERLVAPLVAWKLGVDSDQLKKNLAGARAGALSGSNAKADAARARIEAERDRALQRLRDENSATSTALEAEYKKKLTEAAETLIKANEEYRSALRKAAKSGQVGGMDLSVADDAGSSSDPRDALKKQIKFGGAGAFNASSIQSLQGFAADLSAFRGKEKDGDEEKKHLASIDAGVRKLNDHLMSSGLAFT